MMAGDDLLNVDEAMTKARREVPAIANDDHVIRSDEIQKKRHRGGGEVGLQTGHFELS